MARRLIDLSIAITNDIVAGLAQMRPKIAYVGHKESVPQLQSYKRTSAAWVTAVASSTLDAASRSVRFAATG